jgi:hypothetical protein
MRRLILVAIVVLIGATYVLAQKTEPVTRQETLRGSVTSGT